MSSNKHSQWFLEKVSDRARVPEGDAHELVQDFVDALSKFVESDQLGVVLGMIPVDVKRPDSSGAEAEDVTIDAFLSEMSDEESVGDGRAAEHARAVAETLGEHAGKDGQRDLQEAITHQGILALFEGVRGEMTPQDVPTKGVEQRHDDIPDEG